MKILKLMSLLAGCGLFPPVTEPETTAPKERISPLAGKSEQLKKCRERPLCRSLQKFSEPHRNNTGVVPYNCKPKFTKILKLILPLRGVSEDPTTVPETEPTEVSVPLRGVGCFNSCYCD